MLISAWRSCRRGGWISSGLNSRLVQRGGMFLVALVLLCTGCGDATPGGSRLSAVGFTEDGLEVTIVAPASGAVIAVETAEGVPVQQLPVPAGESSPRLLFPWTSGQAYRFTLLTSDGPEGAPIEARAPVRGPLRAVMRLPYGQAEARFMPEAAGTSTVALATGGAPVQLGIELTSVSPLPLEVTLSLDLAGGLEGVERSVDGGGPADRRWTLTPADPAAQLLMDVKVPPGEGEYPVTATLRYREGGMPEEVLTARTVLLTRPAEAVSAQLEVVDHLFPTDRLGAPQRHRLPDTVALSNPLWRTLGRVFGARVADFDPYAPYAFQTATFENHTDWPVTVLVTATTRNPLTGEGVPAFVPQAFEVTGGTGRITTLARLPARGEGRAIVPFYLRREVMEGSYVNELEVKLLGSDAVIHRLERPLTVVRSDLRVNATLLVVTPLSLFGLIFFAVRYRRLISSFDARALITIALFGALMFSSGFLTELVSVSLNVVLGPFNLLVGGMLYEILHHLVLTTLITQYPRPGVAALVGITHYLMRGLTTGQLSPVDLLFVGSSLAYKELALYGVGVTRQGAVLERLERSPGWTKVQVVVGFALASGATAFTSLALHTAFYRLFFAPWYIWLTVAVGLLGPIPGVLMGLRFGRELNRVRE